MPTFWSNWHENVILWLRLGESLIVPLLFYLTDSPHRAALRRAFQRRSGKFSDFGDNGRYRMYIEDALEGQMKPSPFGSVTPIGIITNYRRKEKREQKHSQKRNCSNTGSKRYILTSIYGIDTILNPSHFKNNLKTVVQTKPQPEKHDACSITKHGNMQMDIGTWRDDETHIYASLSDSFSNLSYQSSLPDGSVFGLSFTEAEEQTYDGSFTTIANDDFEFHDTRLGVIDLLMHANDTNFKPESVPKLSESALEEETYKSLENEIQLSENNNSLETVQDLVIRIDSLNDSFCGKSNFEFENTSEKTRHQPNDTIPFHMYRVSTEELCKSALPRSGNSWFSMNDLDRIGDKNDWTNCESEEAMFVVPEKSESMVSLYEVPRTCDQAKAKSVSESNLFCEKDSAEIHPKSSSQEENFSSEGRLLEALWKNNRSSLVLGRGSHVRKAKKRKTKNKQKYGDRSSSRKPLEELGPDLNGVCCWNKDRHTGPMLIEEYMRPIDALHDSPSHEEKNIQNSEMSINNKDSLQLAPQNTISLNEVITDSIK
ncbi:uncharacterized protein LOC111085346 isoform X2 [Limulus polyphemus]|uniref:Uncharacterized protein LOC111085346 isoform X2 n=1 Tax=Limulus polyphemus TaxID=6850 RepID=A0ABM1S6H1_LIMPO|nr:uncharacterized protein LOC111085346 isoform X2 [Limulus polyphemus]